MEYGELKTHMWNLSFVAVASTVMGGCGPFVMPDVETDTIDDPNPGPEPSDTTWSPPDPSATFGGGECQSSQDCSFGYACFEGQCIYYYGDTCGNDYCCNYYCGDTDTDSYGDTDTESIPPECQQHVDCGDGRVCDGDGFCNDPQALPPCVDVPQVVPLLLPSTSANEIVSLSFVDADQNPWQDLVVGRSGSAELLLGPGDGMPVELPVPPGSTVVDAAAGDFDADGQTDLVLSTESGVVTVLISDGAGGYVQESATAELGTVLDLVPLHFNLDGTLDLALRVEGGGARVYWGDGGGGFAEMYSLQTARPVTSLVWSDLENDADHDLVLQDQGGAKRFEGSNSGNLVNDGLLPGGNSPRALLSGFIGLAPRSDIVGYTLAPDHALLELWPDAQSPQYYTVAGAANLWAGLGDVQADGVPDVVLAGQSSIDYVSANANAGPMLDCVGTYAYASSAIAMAVGDLDGNLRADVALGDAQAVTVLLTQ